MNNRRRHAHNFTDSLSSFRQTTSQEELRQAVHKQSLDDKYKSKNNTSHTDSVILAGSSTSQQYFSLSCNTEKDYNTTCNNKHSLLRRDTLSVSDETSYLPIELDLNKCINLFDNEYLMECNAGQINTTLSDSCNLNKNKTMNHDFRNYSRSVSADTVRNMILPNQEFNRSKSYNMLDRVLKRDTNYNIKGDQLSFPTKSAIKLSHNEKIETIVPSFDALSLSKPALLSRKDDSIRENKVDSTNSEMSSKDDLDPFKLKILLDSLENKKSLKGATEQRHFLKRLSINFRGSPKVFTEELLTIIEESVINNDSYQPLQYPEISLTRFNKELQKISKLIEDETAPEWPESPSMLTSICARSQECDVLQKFLYASALSPYKSLHSTTPRRNIKSPKKGCKRMSKNACIMKDLHDDTNTFENLEAICKQFFPNESSTFPTTEETLQSPLQNMNNIWRTCERQMTSLEDSFNVHEQIKKAGTCTLDSAHPHNETFKAQNLQHKLSNEKYNKMDLRRLSDILKQRTEHDKHQKAVVLDDLESTLMYEIAKKRQRCLDTAKEMMEIDALESTEDERKYTNIITDSSPSSIDDKLMETLMCAKTYYDCLENHVPLLNLLQREKLSTPHTSRDRKNPSTSKQLKTVVAKPRLFLTPGKTSVNKDCKPKRTYFPNLLPGMYNKNKPNISPQNIYRHIGSYDHVVSPVAMYIKGCQLTKVPKTDELTSKRKQSPNPKMKFESSKQSKKKPTKPVGDENVADNFLHT